MQERKKGLESVKESTAAHQKLADEIIKLAAKENKTAGEKRNLKNKIDELNGSIDGLNLAYDKNSNSLSHNADQIKSRISAMEAESTWQTAQQNLLNIEQKRSEVSKKLAENAELRKSGMKKLTSPIPSEKKRLQNSQKKKLNLKICRLNCRRSITRHQLLNKLLQTLWLPLKNQDQQDRL